MEDGRTVRRGGKQGKEVICASTALGNRKWKARFNINGEEKLSTKMIA